MIYSAKMQMIIKYKLLGFKYTNCCYKMLILFKSMTKICKMQIETGKC